MAGRTNSTEHRDGGEDCNANPSTVPEETRDVGDAIDLLCRAISLNELIFMAGESIAIRDMKEAITTGADVILWLVGTAWCHSADLVEKLDELVEEAGDTSCQKARKSTATRQ